MEDIIFSVCLFFLLTITGGNKAIIVEIKTLFVLNGIAFYLLSENNGMRSNISFSMSAVTKKGSAVTAVCLCNAVLPRGAELRTARCPRGADPRRSPHEYPRTGWPQSARVASWRGWQWVDQGGGPGPSARTRIPILWIINGLALAHFRRGIRGDILLIMGSGRAHDPWRLSRLLYTVSAACQSEQVFTAKGKSRNCTVLCIAPFLAL